MRKRWYLLFILGICCLVACGTSSQPSSSSTEATTSSQTAASSTSLRAVNWANFTYHSSCYGNTQPFQARNGKAQNKFIQFQIYQPVIFGDLTGDGQPEAAVRYSCTGADFGGVHVFVYSGQASHPLLLGELPLSDKNGQAGNWSVETITIANQTIQLSGRGYSSSAPHCCPDLHVEARYRWNGKQLVNTQFKTTQQNNT